MCEPPEVPGRDADLCWVVRSTAQEHRCFLYLRVLVSPDPPLSLLPIFVFYFAKKKCFSEFYIIAGQTKLGLTVRNFCN